MAGSGPEERAEGRYRQLVDSSNDIIWVADGAGRLIFVNPAVERLLGYPPAEALGSSLTRFVAPGALEWAEEEFRKVLDGESRSGWEVPFVHRQERLVWLSLHAAPGAPWPGGAGGMWGSARDVTERKLLEEERRVLTEDLEFRVRELTCMLDISRLIRKDTELEELARAIEDLLPGGLRRPEAAVVRVILGDRTAPALGTEDRPGRRIRLPVEARGREIGLFEAATEETAFLSTERDLIEWAAGRLSFAAGRLEAERELREKDRLAALGAFARVLAHEIKNPLNSMNLSMVLMRKRLAEVDGPGLEKLNREVEFFAGEIGRLNGLLEEYLLFGRSHILELSSFNLGELIDELARFMEGDFERAGVRFEARLAGDLHLVADRNKLRQVLLNLFKNAVEETPPGGVLEASARCAGETLEVEVADSGPGVADPERIFEPFYTTKTAGTGLGLSIVREIVRRHGGRISANNRPNGGAVFSLSLPCEGPPAGGGAEGAGVDTPDPDA